MKKLLNNLIRFFSEGLLIVVPFGVTIFLVLYTLTRAKYFVQSFFSYIINYAPYMSSVNSIPFLNLFVVIAFVTFLGYIASNFLVKSMLDILEEIIMGIPVINIVYSYIKDSTSVFTDKFDKPVLVTINKALDIKKVGFITKKTLEGLPLEGTKVAVYVPHSYSFSGELIMVDKKHVAYLGISATDAFRLSLSGGLANLETPHKTFLEIGKEIDTELLDKADAEIVGAPKKRKSKTKKT